MVERSFRYAACGAQALPARRSCGPCEEVIPLAKASGVGREATIAPGPEAAKAQVVELDAPHRGRCQDVADPGGAERLVVTSGNVG
jgi:hypothetical protein